VNRDKKNMGYIVPHLIHELWDVCGVKDMKNVKSQNVFLMSMKNIAYKIDNRPRNPLVASILHLDSRREERRQVNYEVRHDRRRWRLTQDEDGSDGWSWERLSQEATAIGGCRVRKIEEKLVRLQRSWDVGTEATPSTKETDIKYDRVGLWYQCLTICIILNINK
jgi:hypothetical protein